MKTAYIKFCGGCNPRFDRGVFADKLKKHFEGRIDFFTHSENISREIGIVIQGCDRECVRKESLAKADRLIMIGDGSELGEVIDMLERILSA